MLISFHTNLRHKVDELALKTDNLNGMISAAESPAKAKAKAKPRAAKRGKAKA